MNFDDAPHQRQPHPCAGSMRVELFKQSEKFRDVSRGDPFAVILNEDHEFPGGPIYPNFDPGIGLIAEKLHGVINQILEYFHKT